MELFQQKITGGCPDLSGADLMSDQFWDDEDNDEFSEDYI